MYSCIKNEFPTFLIEKMTGCLQIDPESYETVLSTRSIDMMMYEPHP